MMTKDDVVNEIYDTDDISDCNSIKSESRGQDDEPIVQTTYQEDLITQRLIDFEDLSNQKIKHSNFSPMVFEVAEKEESEGEDDKSETDLDRQRNIFKRMASQLEEQ